MAPSNWKKLDPALLGDSLNDTPTDKPSATAANNILPGISAERVIREIKGMLVGTEYLYAEGTLRGILAEVERTEHVTSGQWETIERIIERTAPASSRHFDRKRWR